jgi:hypothetical protein
MLPLQGQEPFRVRATLVFNKQQTRQPRHDLLGSPARFGGGEFSILSLNAKEFQVPNL